MMINDPCDSAAAPWRFDNSYILLPKALYHEALPAKPPSPQLAIFNYKLAEELGFNFSQRDEALILDVFSGRHLPKDAAPIAQAYCGHQFGHFNKLGDGRAILIGEHVTPKNERVDIQLKGGGLTAFSRSGDGSAALGPMLREYLISEALHALSIPTTRSLCVIATGAPVYREKILDGAVLTRIASSHIRVGTFEYAAALRDRDLLRQLADYTIARHYPQAAHSENPYASLLIQAIERQASLIASWMHIGFIHGVMNTDNMAISGETLDYGPCAFLDSYRPSTVFSSIDRHGRYAYQNQPAIAQWNLARFAETLLPLIDQDPKKSIEIAEAAIGTFSDCYDHFWLSGMRRKLGLILEEEDDAALIHELLTWMEGAKADYTDTFRFLSNEGNIIPLIYQDGAFLSWQEKWMSRASRENHSKFEAYSLMRRTNPAIIPRNHYVEEALSSAVEDKNLSKFTILLEALQDPYDLDNKYSAFHHVTAPSNETYRTFCGT